MTSDHTKHKIPILFVDDDVDAAAADLAAEPDDALLTVEVMAVTDVFVGPVSAGNAAPTGDAEEVSIDTAVENSNADVLDGDDGPSISEMLRELEEHEMAEQERAATAAKAAQASQATDAMRISVAMANQALTELATVRGELQASRNEAQEARAELKKAQEERSDVYDAFKRQQADFENFRKRTDRDRADAHDRMVADVAVLLLPAIDNLRRALLAEASVEASESEAFRHFLHGVELIFKQLNEVLGSIGVQPVRAIGEPFDPHFHEAVATEESTDVAPDIVIAELAPGYRIGEKLLRPAMVKVSTRP